MKSRELPALLFVICGYLLLRGTALGGPFVLPFETAFQEAIAIHHLENGIIANRLLPVFATIDGTSFYHTAHPPLLHIIYALLYRALGSGEWVTRCFSIVLFIGSSLFWRSLAGKDTSQGWMVFPLAFFAPAPFLLMSTTNYEPLSIFMVSLIAWLTLVKRSGLLPLALAVTVGMLVDWPVYLAVPALLILKWRDPELRKTLLILLGWEALFFLGLQAYQYSVAGEAAFFSHAPDRANPFILFTAAPWMEFTSHLAGVCGIPFLLIFSAGIIALAIDFFRPASDSVKENPGHAGAGAFFVLFFILLFLSAPGLVSRHFVYLLYLTPVMAFALLSGIKRTGAQKTALIAVIILVLPADYILARHRNFNYYGMALPWTSCGGASNPPETAFSSAAIGTWKYYANIETVHPMSAAASKWLEENRPDIIHLDRRSPEVEAFRDIGAKDSGYELAFPLAGERVYFSKAGKWWDLHHYLIPENGAPATFIEGPFTRAGYSIAQRPGMLGSRISAKVKSGNSELLVSPYISHVLDFVKSDGVTFTIQAAYDIDGGGNKNRLLYFRYLADGEVPRHRTGINLSGIETIDLITGPGPWGNHAFDDAYWVEPVVFAGLEDGTNRSDSEKEQ